MLRTFGLLFSGGLEKVLCLHCWLQLKRTTIQLKRTTYGATICRLIKMLKRIDERLHRLASSYSDDERRRIRGTIYQHRWRDPENRYLWDQRLDTLRRIS